MAVFLRTEMRHTLEYQASRVHVKGTKQRHSGPARSSEEPQATVALLRWGFPGVRSRRSRATPGGLGDVAGRGLPFDSSRIGVSGLCVRVGGGGECLPAVGRWARARRPAPKSGAVVPGPSLKPHRPTRAGKAATSARWGPHGRQRCAQPASSWGSGNPHR